MLSPSTPGTASPPRRSTRCRSSTTSGWLPPHGETTHPPGEVWPRTSRMTTQRQRPSSACSAARSASVLGPVPAYLPTRSSTPRGLTGRSTTRSPRSTITTRSASPCSHLRRNRDLHDDLTCIVDDLDRSEEHTSELQSLMRISYAVFCLKKKKQQT